MSLDRENILSRIASAAAMPDEQLEIAQTALLLASLDLPEQNLTYYQDHLKKIELDLDTVAKSIDHVYDMAAALSDVLCRFHGYSGDTESYDDMQNANLMRVIDRRKGLPVALGILFVHMARAQNWAITGVNFPGHFLLRLTRGGEQVVIDPFRNARRMAANDLARLVSEVQGPGARLQPHYLQSVSDREILLRLQNNIKSRALEADNADRALNALESMCLIAPDNSSVVLELAVLESKCGSLKQALDRLSAFLERQLGHPDESQIASLIQNLKRKLN